MQAKTYSVGTGGVVRRLDNLSGPWINVSPSLTIPNISNYDLYDVETDPNDGNKVFVVGVGSTSASAFGVYVSFDGGITWIIPGGNYQSAHGASNRLVWNEVSVVDSNTIAICGNEGYVAISNDGGLTFNQMTRISVNDDPSVLDVLSIHFVTPTIGVVAIRRWVLKTFNAGATWQVMNGGFPITGTPNFQNGWGIHLSQDFLTLTVLSETAIFRSTNGGNTFTNVHTWPFPGLHLTWTDDQNLWAFGVNNQKIRSTNGGLTWSVITAYSPSSPNHRAGHFYQIDNGFYSGDSVVYSTYDGAVTGVVSDNFPSKEVNAIWTWFDPSICYRLIPCEEGVEDIIVTNDLSASVGKVIEVCPSDLPPPRGTSGSGSNGIPFDQVPPSEEPVLLVAPQFELIDCCGIQPTIIVANNLFPYVNGIVYIPVLGNTCWTPVYVGGASPEALLIDLTGATYYNECETCNEDHGCNFTPELTQCNCYTIAVAESCQQAITLVNIGLISNNCLSCAKQCYYLTDCTNDENVIQTGQDMSSYVGTVVKLKDCPDTCWLVTVASNCDVQSCISEVIDTFETCIECLPPVIPTPFELHSRRVKPGYYTPGCPPEYTEKVNCNFGEQMYDKMLAARYGLTQCCAEDLQKWDIKKSLLDLNAIYDPELCKCILPPKCCPPSNVQAVIFTTCNPPTNVSATIEI